jgi:hypothetical protein
VATIKPNLAAAWNVKPTRHHRRTRRARHCTIRHLAKTPGAVQSSLDARMAILRELILERHELAFHREAREIAGLL